ncbi:MAG TPA: TlpA disulfide reductase family protein [Albitalea sp.]|nr:TlpA disulfide reductase family protein [Albitalea sp.]
MAGPHSLHSFLKRPLAAALLLAALAAAWPAAAGTPGEVEVGQVLREATLQGLNGNARRLSEFRGRPLIINVWASWCGPCRAETASLERLAWVDTPRRATIIGISTDDDAQAARAWLKRSNATLSHFIDRRLEMEHMLGADKLPLTVLVDADGRVVRKVYGAQQWDSPQARELIEQAFRATSGPRAGQATKAASSR